MKASGTIVTFAMLSLSASALSQTSVLPQAEAESLSICSRSRDDLALLSFQVSDEIAAQPEIVSAIERHLATLADREPRLRTLCLHHSFAARQISLRVDEATAKQVSTGQSPPWSALHSKLRIARTTLQEPSVFASDPVVVIEYGAIYNIRRLAKRYETLPGIRSVEPNWILGDGPRIYIERNAGRWQYIVDIASGDCLAGCYRHELHYFLLDEVGRILADDQWFNPRDDSSPQWVEHWKHRRLQPIP